MIDGAAASLPAWGPSQYYSSRSPILRTIPKRKILILVFK
jgi:hypothetical protein